MRIEGEQRRGKEGIWEGVLAGGRYVLRLSRAEAMRIEGEQRRGEEGIWEGVLARRYDQ